jgi:hypothetical protein
MASFADILLKPDTLRCLLAYLDSEDVRAVSLLDCLISDTQYLRPQFLHLLSSGELVLDGLQARLYATSINIDVDPEMPREYMKWLAARNISVRCVSFELELFIWDWRVIGDWIKRHAVHWEHAIIDNSTLDLDNCCHESEPRTR